MAYCLEVLLQIIKQFSRLMCFSNGLCWCTKKISLKHVLNSSQFENLLIANSFFDWYTVDLNTTNWNDFNSYTNVLVDICVWQLETYFSTKWYPTQSKLMHSSKPHHLFAVVAFQFSLLVTKFAKFQLQYKQENFN